MTVCGVKCPECPNVHPVHCPQALHQLAQLKTVKKELTESLAVLDALENAIALEGGAGHDATAWHIIDLACGRGITASIAALRYPLARVTAVDRIDDALMPHWEQAPHCQVRLAVIAWRGSLEYQHSECSHYISRHC